MQTRVPRMSDRLFPHLPRLRRRVSLWIGWGGSAAPCRPRRGVMSRRILAFGVLAIAALSGAAAAQEANSTVPPGAAPITQPLSQRFALIVLDQFDRDLARGSTTINMMFDTQ